MDDQHPSHCSFSFLIYNYAKREQNRPLRIIIPCFVGTFGFGDKFSTLISGRCGIASNTGDISDVASCIKAFRKSKEQQLVILGNSYGGYLAVRSLSTLSEINFAAVIAISPFVEWCDFLDNEQPNSYSRIFLGEEIFQKHCVKRSPSFHFTTDLANIKCPLFVAHGALDDVCPVTETYKIQKHLNSESLLELHVYENVGHGIDKTDFETKRDLDEKIFAFLFGKVL